MTDDRRRFVLGAILAGFVTGALALGSAAAETTDVFYVTGVEVDVTAETAATAREQALARGEAIAFDRLLQRLVRAVERDRLPEFSANEIAGYVRDFAVAREQTSAVRYIATLDVRFKATEVRRLLLDYGVAFAETPSKPVIVLPVYRRAGAVLLWDDPNPWLEAWRQRPATDGLVPLVLPQADLTDIVAIGAEQAVKGDWQRLSVIASRYGAHDALVVLATFVVGDGPPMLEVTLTRYGTALDAQTLVRTFDAGADEGPDDLLRRAAVGLAREVEDAWKRDNRMAFGRPAVMAVTVPVGGLGDWLAIRGRLERVAVVRRIELVLLSRDEVRVNLHYIGESEQLVLALEQADLVLGDREGERVVEMVGAAPAGKR